MKLVLWFSFAAVALSKLLLFGDNMRSTALSPSAVQSLQSLALFAAVNALLIPLVLVSEFLFRKFSHGCQSSGAQSEVLLLWPELQLGGESLFRKRSLRSLNSLFQKTNSSKSPNTRLQLESLRSSFSSSASSAPLGTDGYEVFLSFRGPDTRNNFADFLYNSLVRSKIRTFRDDEEVRKGEKIGAEIIQAISQSKVYIPIFSPNYASSKWCLQELAQMVECFKGEKGHVILPIFYFVQPSQVRHDEEGSYHIALEQHLEKYDSNTVQEWRTALQEVASMKGWHVTDSDRQATVVDEVFEKVLSHLNKNHNLVTDELVGMDHHLEAVIGLLNMGSHGPKVVGVHGMGGIGKTTIATAVYNKIYEQFDECCFLGDLRETLEQKEGIVDLQTKLISRVLKFETPIDNASEGIHMIKDRVCRYKLLIVLDDVDDKFEFDKIVGPLENFSPESRFIITTRNRKVLSMFEGCELYRPGEMSFHNSLQLFSKHAFRRDSPPEAYMGLCRDLVSTASGLPLTLKVVGASLFAEDEAVWEDTLIQLKELPPTQVQERLKVSFKALTYEEQQIFLDIACFSIEKDLYKAVHMWAECGFYPFRSIKALIHRSLIKFGRNNELEMHDQLRDLGKTIVSEGNIERPWNRSRIWSNKAALDIFNCKEGTEEVKALKVNTFSKFQLTSEHFKKLSGLRYLETYQAELTGDFSELLPALRWLRLYYHQGDSSLTNFHLKKLVVLELCQSYITDDWGGWKHIEVPVLPTSLKRLAISSMVPELSDLADLKELEFTDCQDGFEIPGDVWKLPKLEVLRVHSSNSTSLLRGMGVLPSTLKELKILHCPLLEKLPDLSNLKFLSSLTLSCTRLCEIPGLGEMKLLKILYVQNGSNLRHLNGLGNLQYLTDLVLERCLVMDELPNLAAMNKMLRLWILQCPRIQIVRGLSEVKSLVRLRIRDCASLQRLPDLSKLAKLKEFTLGGCHSLLNIDGPLPMQTLEYLHLFDFKVIERLPSLSEFIMLKQLVVQIHPCLRYIGGIIGLNSLERLWLRQCDSLTTLPDLSGLKNLKELDLGRCKSLTEVGGIQRLTYLKVLNMSGCHSLVKLPDLSSLTKLEKLWLSGCEKLTQVLGVEELKSLKVLEMSGCKSIDILPDLSQLANLATLSVQNCEKLTELPGIEELESLTMVDASGCGLLKDMPHLQNTQLEVLRLAGCTSLERLPNLSILKNLKELNVSGCIKLSEVVGLEELRCLNVLDMNGCHSINSLPNLSDLKCLKCLHLRGCKRLSELLGVENLESLTCLSKERSPSKLVKLAQLDSILQVTDPCVALSQHFQNRQNTTLPNAFKSEFELCLSRFTGIALRTPSGLSYEMEVSWLGLWSCFVAIAALLLPLLFFFFFYKLKRSSESSNAASPSEPADSSSLPALPTGEFEVFLSFRGPDTRNSISDFLYTYLSRSKIRTFRGDEELRKGEDIGPGLVQAIHQSKIYIPIFSENYASSKWCLQELAKMVECCKGDKGHVVLPIFFYVDPSDVRHQTGPYKRAFEEYQNKYAQNTIQEWKEALEKVGAMKGWHVTDSNGQGAIVDEVFADVSSILNKDYALLTDELVGIDHHVEAVVKMLNMDSEGVKTVGIHGMGGIGKTTIAMAVYDKISPLFDGPCFLEDVREMLQQREGTVSLQNKLISGIVQGGNPVTNVSEAAAGLPLALKVLGSLLYREDKVVWVEKLAQLKEIPPTDVQKRSLVKLERKKFKMHDQLRDLGRSIVREESFERPWKRSRVWSNTDAVDMLNEKKGSKKVQALEVYLKEESAEQHHLTSEEFKKLSELRYLRADCEGLEGDFQGLVSNLRYLRMEIYEGKASPVVILTPPPKPSVSMQMQEHPAFTNFHPKKLVILDLSGSTISNGWEGWTQIKVAKDLKVLDLHDCNGFSKVPDLSKFGNLEVLDLHSCHFIVQELDIGNLKNLKILKLSNSGVTKLTVGSGILQRLEKIDANSCYRLVDIADIGNLPSLTVFMAAGTEYCKEVPDLPTSLKVLSISLAIPNLAELLDLQYLEYQPRSGVEIPSDMWKLSKLEILILRRVTFRDPMRALPSSLKRLHFDFCPELVKLPNLGNLEILKELRMSSPKLVEIEGLGELKSLVILFINHAPKLNSLGGLDNLHSLARLTLSKCPEIECLPSLANLKKLESLIIIELPRLTSIEGLDELECLEALRFSDCTSLQSLPGMSKLTRLKSLTLTRCQSLVTVEGLESLTALERLQLQDTRFERLPSLAKLIKLKNVNLQNNQHLREIEGIEYMKLLESLWVAECESLERLPDLSGLKKLKELNIRGCTKLPRSGDLRS
ncbi:unnamed protein product [Linum tenue]|uniref:TIR domain-containing protein n=1 Tax=Linum tenue TaxID=586396 RepID=A0AAV0GQR2_9ROSI|nr:unnamed protein product [Linum tenue]